MLHWHFDVIAGAGALVMPAADLARYAQAALGARQARPSARRSAWRSDAMAPARMQINALGLGWVRAPLNGRILLQP